MSAKIKKGDDVIVLSGKDKGKTGKVLKIIKGKDKPTKAIVEGANIVKKHTKQSATQKGGIESIEMPSIFALSPSSISIAIETLFLGCDVSKISTPAPYLP